MKLPAQRMNEVVRQVEQQGVVACPAEAVWGLTCDPLSEEAVLPVSYTHLTLPTNREV